MKHTTSDNSASPMESTASDKTADLIIIGLGPAGISAALYAVRAGLSTVVIGKDKGALGKAHKIENYYGFKDGITGNELFENGVEAAKRLGAEIIRDEVIELTYDFNEKTFHIKTVSDEYTSSAAILAAGGSRKSPGIDGLKEYEGKGISYCAVCDAFFYKDKSVAVIGNSDYAVSEALHLSAVCSEVTILTNGLPLNASLPANLKSDERKIASLDGNEFIESVLFEDSSKLPISAVFIAIGTASSVDLARKLGVADSEGKIILESDMSTPIPGFFAAGDCTGGLLQVAKAVYEGALAATSAIKFLK